MNKGTMIKRLQDIMRQDAGINGDAQRIEQIVWMLFLKLYDAKEFEWEIIEDNYKSLSQYNFCKENDKLIEKYANEHAEEIYEKNKWFFDSLKWM